jgi:NADPH-dependent ferric siderophore reductase
MAVRRTPTHAVAVTAVTDLTPRMRRVTLTGPSLVGIAVEPAQDVELILADGTGHRLKRRYTIRTARPAAGEVDIDALVHAHGPGGRWAAGVVAGDTIEFLGPRGHLELRPAAWHLFVGDEAALPAFAALVEALPPDQQAIVLAEVGSATDELPIQRHAGELTVIWLHRDGTAAGRPDLLAAALTKLATPAGAGQAYLLGESRAVVALRPHVLAHGLTIGQMFLKGYWNIGRPGRQVPS